MLKQKKVTKSGGITIPRAIRQAYGLLPGVPVDISADENGVLVSKRIPSCYCCGTVEDVKCIHDLEICRGCAEEIVRCFNNG